MLPWHCRILDGDKMTLGDLKRQIDALLAEHPEAETHRVTTNYADRYVSDGQIGLEMRIGPYKTVYMVRRVPAPWS